VLSPSLNLLASSSATGSEASFPLGRGHSAASEGGGYGYERETHGHRDGAGSAATQQLRQDVRSVAAIEADLAAAAIARVARSEVRCRRDCGV